MMLRWEDAQVGRRVQISDAAHLRHELQNSEKSAHDIEEIVARCAGGRGRIRYKPKTRLEIVESDGCLKCELLRSGGSLVSLPLSVLWEDAKFEQIQHERETAVQFATEIIQKWWRDQLYFKVLESWRDRMIAEKIAERAIEVQRRSALLIDNNTADKSEDAGSCSFRTQRRRSSTSSLCKFMAEIVAEDDHSHKLLVSSRSLYSLHSRRASSSSFPAVSHNTYTTEEILDHEEATRIIHEAIVALQCRIRRMSAVQCLELKRRKQHFRNEESKRKTRAATTLQSGMRISIARQRAEDLRNKIAAQENKRAECERIKVDIFAAAESGNVAALNQLLPQWQEIAESDELIISATGATPLIIACARGHLATAKALFEHGIDPNLANSAGWTPLHRACFAGQVAIVKWLLTPKHGKPSGAGADVAALSQRGSSAAHASIPSGHVRVLRLLSERRPEGFGRMDLLAKPNDDGDTPLHFAVMCRQLVVARFLVNQKVDLECKNKDGLTALDLADRHGETTIAALIRAAMLESDGTKRPLSTSDPSLKQQSQHHKRKKNKTMKRKTVSSNRNDWQACGTLQQALILAWKLASDDVCTRIAVKVKDLKIVLDALSANYCNSTATSQFALLELSTNKAMCESLTAAAANLGMPLRTSLGNTAGGVARKQLLECIRSPAVALRHIHDTGRISGWNKPAIVKLLELLKLHKYTIPAQFQASGQDLLEFATLTCTQHSFDSFTCPSAMLHARLLFHLAIIRHLGHWEGRNGSNDQSAGSGAAHALAIQRQKKLSSSDDGDDADDDADASPKLIVYRPSGEFTAFQRAEEAIAKEVVHSSTSWAVTKSPAPESSPRVHLAKNLHKVPSQEDNHKNNTKESQQKAKTAAIHNGNEVDSIEVIGLPMPISPQRATKNASHSNIDPRSLYRPTASPMKSALEGDDCPCSTRSCPTSPFLI